MQVRFAPLSAPMARARLRCSTASAASTGRNGGKLLFEGEHDLTGANRVAQLGIARTFQNIGLYTYLNALDNLMAARHIHMRQNMLASALYWGFARKEETRHRAVVEELIDFLEIAHIRKTMVGALPYGLRKRVELGRAAGAGTEAAAAG